MRRVVIPRKGKPAAARREHEHTRSFRRLVKWRTGAEGRISHLKHAYAWDRTLLDGIGGAETWCGLGVLAHNSVKISALVEAKSAGGATRAARRRAIDPVATGPPPGPPDASVAC